MGFRSKIIASSFINAALAATSTISATASVTSIFLPGFDQQGLVASVITAAPTATAYFVQCNPNAVVDCGLGGGVTLTEGPSTFEVSINSTDMTISEACQFSSNTASCTYSTPGGEPAAESATGLQAMYLNVTITAGFEALASASSISAASVASISSVSAASVASISSVLAAEAAAKTADVLATATGTATVAATASSTSSSKTSAANPAETDNGMGSAGIPGARRDIGGVAAACLIAAGLLAM
ncbi:hypothetical protein PFICI_05169 [Pestalotiopsis fici W106-1]|uniref:GPI anchored cell wall protein n=1 Tax=Pestalotiopsis fici (strain W106-1 / CGMCC3.15140) TaxID=1229662 RepID=W3XB35_PESFW|nr:uncharacterized protein PFICI_05169 [Pestalotiopsis fici W106-1]ETS83293.1 hypothetical protein PFICI_05169 [Pestalotiopsis fici W106-1]